MSRWRSTSSSTPACTGSVPTKPPPPGSSPAYRTTPHSGWKACGPTFHRPRTIRPSPRAQIKQLRQFVDLQAAAGAAPDLVHAANSAGALLYPEARFDMVRIGLAMYGCYPSPACREVVTLQPAMRVVSQVVHTRRLPAGARPTYGRIRPLEAESTVATIPIGYADGITRRLAKIGGEVLIGGKRRPYSGVVTMDQIVITMGDDPVQVGDEVVLLGRPGRRGDRRRRVGGTIGLGQLGSSVRLWSPAPEALPGMTLTSVPGIEVGHWTDPVGRTGATVVSLPEPNRVVAEVRGAAPGSRELALLAPGMRVEEIQAIVLTGGSAFGLAAADGVVRALEADGRGHPTARGPVPIVPAAVIYDLLAGDAQARPGPEEGAAAYAAASAGSGGDGLGGGRDRCRWWPAGGGPEHFRPGGLGSASIDARARPRSAPSPSSMPSAMCSRWKGSR